MHGNLKNISKCSHSHISQSHWQNCEIILDTGFLNYLNSTTQLFCKLFLTQLTRIRIWNIISIIDNYRHIIWKTNLSNYLPITHICVFSLYRFSDIGIIITSQRRFHACDPQNHAYIFYNTRFVAARFGNLLPDFGFVMYLNEFIHVIIGFKHDVPALWDRRHSGTTRIRRCTRRYAQWLILVAPSCGYACIYAHNHRSEMI